MYIMWFFILFIVEAELRKVEMVILGMILYIQSIKIL